MQAQLTFTAHETKQLNGQHGPYTLHIFKTGDGTDFTTTKTDIANAAYALLNQSIVATYEETQKPGNDGRIFTNRRLSAVQAANGMAPGVMPSGSQPAPTGTSLPLAPATSPAPITKSDDAAPRIARAVAYEHLPEYVASGLLAAPGTVGELYDVLGGLAKWIFSGSRPQVAAGADSSGAGGDDGGSSASAAPPVAETTPQAPAVDDDIPF